MSDYDIRKHPADIEALIEGLAWNWWVGGQQSVGTKPLDLIEMSIANYSDRGFMVERRAPRHVDPEVRIQRYRNDLS